MAGTARDINILYHIISAQQQQQQQSNHHYYPSNNADLPLRKRSGARAAKQHSSDDIRIIIIIIIFTYIYGAQHAQCQRRHYHGTRSSSSIFLRISYHTHQNI